MRIVVTGGAGFVGASLCTALATRRPADELVAFDNLHRRGSELNLPRLREAGVPQAKIDTLLIENPRRYFATAGTARC